MLDYVARIIASSPSRDPYLLFFTASCVVELTLIADELRCLALASFGAVILAGLYMFQNS